MKITAPPLKETFMTKAALYASWFVFGFLCAMLFIGIWSAFIGMKENDDEDDID